MDNTKLKEILGDDEKMMDFIRSKSKLYTAYSVKDKDGKFRSVIDIESVINLLRELNK